MKKSKSYLKVIIVFLCLFIASCSREQQAETPANEISANPDVVAADPELIEEGVLHKVEKKQQFSSPGKQDLFELSLDGDTPMKGEITFKITTAEGKLIYEEHFSGNLLIDYAIQNEAKDAGNITDAERNDYIIKKMNSFFDDDSFFKVSEKQELIPEHLIKDNWDEIKNNQDKTAFFYSIGEENLRYIAYSDKQGKAVMYYNCC